MKRLRVTKNGKVKARGKGHNHFNAKERRRRQLSKNRTTDFVISNKSASRFLTR